MASPSSSSRPTCPRCWPSAPASWSSTRDCWWPSSRGKGRPRRQVMHRRHQPAAGRGMTLQPAGPAKVKDAAGGSGLTDSRKRWLTLLIKGRSFAVLAVLAILVACFSVATAQLRDGRKHSAASPSTRRCSRSSRAARASSSSPATTTCRSGRHRPGGLRRLRLGAPAAPRPRSPVVIRPSPSASGSPGRARQRAARGLRSHPFDRRDAGHALDLPRASCSSTPTVES